MNCADVQDWISSSFTDVFDVDTLDEMTKHINDCDECRSWYEEVQELAQLWTDDTPVPNLNLVTPVLEALERRAKRDGRETYRHTISDDVSTDELAVRTVVPRINWNLSTGASLVNYGLAASITIALFGFGVFQHAGHLVNGSVGLSAYVNHFVHMISNL